MGSDTTARRPKLFVLDTNVILHDAGCIRNFEENDIAIPIAVLEELDKFKKGNDDINFQAREFLRRIDELTGDVLSREGASLGPGLGSIRVVLGNEFDERLERSFFQDTMDHRILDTALFLHETETSRRVILVSKDTNLRMKAKSLGLRAQDYTARQGREHREALQGQADARGRAERRSSRGSTRTHHGVVPAADVHRGRRPAAERELRPPQRLLVGARHATAPRTRCSSGMSQALRYGITPRNAEQSFALEALINDDIKLVTLAGKAGTGKTLLALAAALRVPAATTGRSCSPGPIVPLSNRDLGYLPGDVDGEARSLHAAAVRQPRGDPQRVRRRDADGAADPADAASRRSW